VQKIEDRGRKGQHDRAADLPEIGCMHRSGFSYGYIKI
jgi:hypothetical protein